MARRKTSETGPEAKKDVVSDAAGLLFKPDAAGPAPPDRSLSLWNRFKAARDRVREKADAYFKSQLEEAGVNLKSKEALCEKAEALAASTDWNKTAEAIKALQLEWKGIGPVSRGHEKAMSLPYLRTCA